MEIPYQRIELAEADLRGGRAKRVQQLLCRPLCTTQQHSWSPSSQMPVEVVILNLAMGCLLVTESWKRVCALPYLPGSSFTRR